MMSGRCRVAVLGRVSVSVASHRILCTFRIAYSCYCLVVHLSQDWTQFVCLSPLAGSDSPSLHLLSSCCIRPAFDYWYIASLDSAFRSLSHPHMHWIRGAFEGQLARRPRAREKRPMAAGRRGRKGTVCAWPWDEAGVAGYGGVGTRRAYRWYPGWFCRRRDQGMGHDSLLGKRTCTRAHVPAVFSRALFSLAPILRTRGCSPMSPSPCP